MLFPVSLRAGPGGELNSKDTNKLEELRAYNEALENSEEYQRIIPDVMKEICTQYANERIRQLEEFIERAKDDPRYNSEPIITEDSLILSPLDKMSEIDATKVTIALAKELLPENPERAAEYVSQLGSCHTLWAMQKNILKEKYGITWYTPSELNPDIIFD